MCYCCLNLHYAQPTGYGSVSALTVLYLCYVIGIVKVRLET